MGVAFEGVTEGGFRGITDAGGNLFKGKVAFA
jgi:hypothetical protein